MKLNTTRFGEVDIKLEDVITFPQGIPGFERDRRFVILQPNKEIPFSFLQSAENGGISFIITNPFWFYREYEFDLPSNVQEELRIQKKEELTIWSIITIKDDIQHATLNLQAPIVINEIKKIGMQVILHETNFHTKHKLLR